MLQTQFVPNNTAYITMLNIIYTYDNNKKESLKFSAGNCFFNRLFCYTHIILSPLLENVNSNRGNQ